MIAEICLIASILLGSPAFAGNTSARIASILVYEGGNLVYVYPVGGVQGAPSCHGSNGNYYSFSLGRARAKEYYAGLMAAYLSGKTVSFTGKGSCTDQTVSETLSYFQF